MKSILILTTFLFISCGREAGTDTQTAGQTTVPELNIQIDEKNEVGTVTPTLSSESSTSVNSGTAVALTFINAYVDNCNKMRDAIRVKEWINASDLVTTEFKNELNRIVDEAYREDPELGLDADPIFDAQDFPDKGFILDDVDGQYLTVRGKDWPDFKLKMKVENVADNWLVDGCGMINIPTDKRIGR